jgi:hypothetical protein
MPQKILLQVPSGKTCRVSMLVVGRRGGQKWAIVAKETATEGTVELNLSPGRYKLSYKLYGRYVGGEFQVK